MTKAILDKLREELEGWKESQKIRTIGHNQAKRNQRLKELELKQSKRIVYLTYKELREAKKKIKQLKVKISGYPSKVRRWTKENMDKVLK